MSTSTNEIVYDIEAIELFVERVDAFVLLFAHVLLEYLLVVEHLVAVEALEAL